MNAKINISPVNENLEKFYKGFKHFSALDVQPEQIIFRTAYSRVVDCVKEANKRINELCLPLEALPFGGLSNNFIVRPINDQSTFERLSEMMEVCHV